MFIMQPPLRMRCGLFIDGLRAATGFGRVRIERQIREHQYETYRLKAPSDETVAQWFKLQRPVAFERNLPDDGISPWLMAAEREFKGSSFYFFHPLVDLLLGTLESSAFWDMQLSKIPESWIEEEERSGCPEAAAEWRAMNEAKRRRLHRKKRSRQVEDLTFVHLSLLRLPDPIRSTLFFQATNRGSFERRYGSPEEECRFLTGIQNVHGLAGLVGLVKEAALIGDAHRHRHIRESLKRQLEVVAGFPECRRVFADIQFNVRTIALSVDCKRYHRTAHHGFGLPASWRLYLEPLTGLQPLPLKDS